MDRKQEIIAKMAATILAGEIASNKINVVDERIFPGAEDKPRIRQRYFDLAIEAAERIHDEVLRKIDY